MPDSYSPIDQNDARAAGVAAGLGCSIVVSIIGSILGGLLLDRWLGTSPWFTLGGVAFGMLLAAYQLYELTSLGRNDQKAPVVTRQITKVVQKASKKPSENQD